MTRSDSILHQMAEQGRVARRVQLKGSERDAEATERYAILGEIARGGTGVVHKGRDNDLGRDVALKVLREDHLNTKEFIERFVEEAQIGGQLQHPGIVPVYELGLRSDKRPYFAMKLVKGETLATRLAARKDPADGRRGLLAVYREVCRTMAYAHSRSVIHRDLKPSNVMIGSFGEVQVVDWGFAKVMRRGGVADERLADKKERDVTMISTVRRGEGSSHSVAGSVMGTPGYMSPEQAMGRVDDLDDKSDLFGLGAILCEILTGKPPYTGSSQDRMAAAAQALLVPAHERLGSCGADERLVSLCKRCLQPLPKDRPASPQALADEIAGYLADAESRAHRAQLRALEAEEHAEAQRRGRRLATHGGLAAAAALLIATGTWFWIDYDATQRERDTQGSIQLALQDAERLRAAGQWSEALAAVKRAIALGDNGALAATIQREAQEAESKQRRDAEDKALLAELEEIRLRRMVIRSAHARRIDEFSDAEADAAYEAAITTRWPNFAVDTERLRSSRFALELAAVFDSWALMRRRGKELAETDWRRIEQLAREIDPEHNDLRDALVADDPARLVERATSDDVLELPPALQATIGSALAAAERDDESTALLHKAERRHPDDSWIHFRIGRAAELRKQWDKAVQHFTAALALRPDSVELRHRIGNVLEQTGDFEGALAVWREAFRRQANWIHGYTHTTQVLKRLGRLTDADAEFRKWIAADPDSAGAAGVYGAFLSNRLRQNAEAEQQLRRAIALDRDDLDNWHDLGVVLGLRNDWPGAVDAYRTYAAKAANTAREAEARVELATALWQVGEREASAREAESALANPPEEPRFWARAAMFLAMKGEGSAALAAVDRACGADSTSTNAEVYLTSSRVRHLLGDYEGAAADLRQAIELGRDGADVRIELGDVLSERLGRHDEAIPHFEWVLKHNPDYAAAHHGIGHALFRKGELDEALPCLEKAVGLDDRDVRFWTNLGVLYFNLKEPRETLRCYGKALKIDPNNVLVLANRGSLLLQLGDHPGVIRDLQRVLELDPEHANWKVPARLGESLTKLGRYEKSADAFRKAIALNSEFADLRVNLAVTFQRLARFEEAAGYYLEALALDPNHARAHVNLASVRAGQRDYRAAFASYERALQLDPKLAAGNKFVTPMYRLNQRVPAVLAGEDKPADNLEAVRMARLALYLHDAAGDALRLFRLAIEQDPDAGQSGNSFDAARAAALVGPEHHAQALEWLRTFLGSLDASLSTDPAQVAMLLSRWQPSDFAPIRDSASLGEEFAKFWADVDALKQRAERAAKEKK